MSREIEPGASCVIDSPFPVVNMYKAETYEPVFRFEPELNWRKACKTQCKAHGGTAVLDESNKPRKAVGRCTDSGVLAELGVEAESELVVDALEETFGMHATDALGLNLYPVPYCVPASCQKYLFVAPRYAEFRHKALEPLFGGLFGGSSAPSAPTAPLYGLDRRYGLDRPWYWQDFFSDAHCKHMLSNEEKVGVDGSGARMRMSTRGLKQTMLLDRTLHDLYGRLMMLPGSEHPYAFAIIDKLRYQAGWRELHIGSYHRLGRYIEDAKAALV